VEVVDANGGVLDLLDAARSLVPVTLRSRRCSSCSSPRRPTR